MIHVCYTSCCNVYSKVFYSHLILALSVFDNYLLFVCDSSTEVRAVMKVYFEKSYDLANQDQELYVLCVQCFEVR